ncbi:MAG: response regulator, partial [Gammaproteobacteria bacterium]|nr:response regulator [Gammaproteobacteria bacterium]
MTRNKVLVVDDNEDILKVMRFLMDSQKDIQAIYAETMQDAKQLALQHRDEIFLSLLDLNLPDAPNGEVVQEVLALGLPAIVFTGNFDPAIRKQYLDMGVVDYVLKENRMLYDYITRLINRIKRNREI